MLTRTQIRDDAMERIAALAEEKGVPMDLDYLMAYVEVSMEGLEDDAPLCSEFWSDGDIRTAVADIQDLEAEDE